MAKPEKPKLRCFSTFLHVLLCSGNGPRSPPVHPSDESENAYSTKETLVVDNAYASSSTPGVVARLMGLDSLPNPKSGTPDSVPRSRSVNFMDYLLEFDASISKHRRVKTSASFREVPSLVHRQKGDEIFVLCMDGNNNDISEEDQERVSNKHVHDVKNAKARTNSVHSDVKNAKAKTSSVCFDVKNHDPFPNTHQEVRHELRKLETGLGELRQRKRQGSKNKESVSVKKERNQGKNKKISKLKNEPRRVPSSKHGSKGRNHHGEANDLSSVPSSSSKCSSCSNGHSGASSRSKLNTSLSNKDKKRFVEPKMRSQKSVLKVESECRLEDHSPVSVLDSNDYPFLYGPDFLDGTSTVASKSKWESPSLLSLRDGVEDSASTYKGYALIDVNNKEAEYYLELMLKLRTLTEQDIEESNCTSKCIRESESFGEICLMFEHKIFDLLLYEVINEVLELYC